MVGPISFFLFKNTIELCGRTFPLGQLTAELLNCGDKECDQLWDMITAIEEQACHYEATRDRGIWFQLNEQLEALSHRLRKWTLFRLLFEYLEEDQLFSDARELLQNYSLFPDEDYSPYTSEGKFSETVQRWLRVKDHEWQQEEELDLPLDEAYQDPVDQDIPKPPAMLVWPGSMMDKWHYYATVILRYESYLSDLLAFNPAIRNFLSFMLDRLDVNSPEHYAEELFFLYQDYHLRRKLMPTSRSKCALFRQVDTGGISFVPREMEDGRFAIAQQYVTHSLQLVLKADFMSALNAGHKIHRCRICGRYFLVQGSYHVRYCEGPCPCAPQFTCRQFGNYKFERELAKDIPKVDVKVKAMQRIHKDLQRGIITPEEAQRAKRYVTDALYEALQLSAVSAEAFKEQLSSASVYRACGITRKSKPRGRPEKKIEEAHEQ